MGNELEIPVEDEQETPRPRPKILITIEGGNASVVLAEVDVEVYVIDYDTDGCEEESIIEVPDADYPGSMTDARVEKFDAGAWTNMHANPKALIAEYERRQNDDQTPR